MASPSLGNVTFPSFRSNLNDILQALDTLNAGTTAPTDYEAYTLWLDTSGTTPVLKMRNGSNSAWVIFDELTSGGAVGVAGLNIDPNLSDFFFKFIGGNTTFTFSSLTGRTVWSFGLELNLSGSYTVSFPASVKWAGGSAPTLISGSTNILGFITRDGGTTWYGNALTEFS